MAASAAASAEAAAARGWCGGSGPLSGPPVSPLTGQLAVPLSGGSAASEGAILAPGPRSLVGRCLPLASARVVYHLSYSPCPTILLPCLPVSPSHLFVFSPPPPWLPSPALGLCNADAGPPYWLCLACEPASAMATLRKHAGQARSGTGREQRHARWGVIVAAGVEGCRQRCDSRCGCRAGADSGASTSRCSAG